MMRVVPEFVRLDPEVAAELRRHAEVEYPRECCGALLGGGMRVRRLRSVTNCAVDPHRRFDVAARELLAVEREAARAGLEVLGYYHSHPDASAAPSEADAHHLCPGVLMLIVAVSRGVAGPLRAWRRHFGSRVVSSVRLEESGSLVE